MVNFLILLKKITPFSKKDIDEGNTPLDVYKLCISIRETFCVSYDIRKENNLYLYIEDECILIRFIGNQLRYLGSDERSQALLLRRILDKIRQIPLSEENIWNKTTPGIYARRFKNNKIFIHSLISMKFASFIFSFEDSSPFNFPFLYHTFEYSKVMKLNQIGNSNTNLLLIPASSSENERLIEILKIIAETSPSMLERITLISLRKIKTLGDKILYINFLFSVQS